MIIKISGMNRIRPGIHGDRVSVTLLPFSEWYDTLQDDRVDDESSDDANSFRGYSRIESKGEQFHYAVSGRVVQVIQPGCREFICSLSGSNGSKSEFGLFFTLRDSLGSLLIMVPLNRRIPYCILRSSKVRLTFGIPEIVTTTVWL